MSETGPANVVTESTETAVTVSEAALEKVRAVMTEQNLAPEERNLRLFVQGGGCGGPSFGLAFDSEEDGDTRIDANGMTVLVDPVSLPYVGGAAIDYVETPEVTGFKVSVPRAGGCSPDSCGSSDQQAAGCGSGGCC